ncbi:MAG TPA: adenylate/guanylate cyclase domain-containing protein [Bacteroidota bacterium]|nr:adenylate/guanylate cyclase domain-containing protein [Bacteroidota bacterium]
MHCRVCSAEVPEGSRYCLNCGATLSDSPAARPSVDGFALIKNYIPPELARKILNAGKQIESERRHVTVLFADVVGFTALSERMDVEMVSTILNDCFRGLIATILKYEGTIDKFIGDGIMAIFGAPLAHENDPERAARCAMDMMADIERFNNQTAIELPSRLGLHVGLHSGMVIAGNVGSDLRMNYSVIGDTVNLAARLVELAPSGEVYLTGETQRLIANIAIAEGPFRMSFKGKAAPVPVYKLRALKAESDVKGDVIGRDEFVGREREIAAIKHALENVLDKNQVTLCIQGEAGVGKSRLKSELIKLAYRSGIASYEGSCSSFEVNTPYFLWTTLMKSLLKVGPEVQEADVRKRLHQITHTLALDEHEPYLGTLLSLRYEEILLVDETLRKQRVFQATRALLSAIAARRPIAFILEDLHWIDRFSQELLEYIFSRTTNVVLSLFVLIYRDEYAHAKEISHGAEVMDLNRLTRGEALKLMKLRMDVDAVPQAIEDLILNRSEGNPFFIQEIIKTLNDKRIIAVRRRKVEILSDNIESGVPETIQGIIMARIDRIQDSIKDVLFSASVIGREFSRPLLEQVIDEKNDVNTNLTELKALELVLEKDEAHEAEYLFKHYLIQEVAYNTILLNKRKELHGAIARAIEELYADRLMEFYELLAFHYEKAEQWDKAAEYLSRSGHKVRQMYSQEESKDFFERKNIAVRKLYQSASAKGSVLATLKAITPPLVAMLVPILPIFAYIRILGRSPSVDILQELLFGVLASLLCVWYAIALWYLGVVPFLRGRPKLYDLIEDQVRIIYREGTTLSIHFSEIDQIALINNRLKNLRPLRYRILDPFGRVSEYRSMSIFTWLKEVALNILPPYSFGFGSAQGEILIRLLAGYRTMRVVIPWWNTPLKSRDLSISPFDAREFYSQLEVAFKKWRRQTKLEKEAAR